MNKKRSILIFCASIWVLAAFIVFSEHAKAGVTEIQALQFGSYIVKNNTAMHSITVNIGGVTTFDPAGFIQISTGQDGIYDIDGLPASMAIASVNVSQTLPLAGGSGENFQMNSFTESHPPSTDAGGVARIRIGATAQTTGSTINYIDQTYTGQLEIQINF